VRRRLVLWRIVKKYKIMERVLLHINKNRYIYVLFICLITFLAKGISKKTAIVDSLEFIKEIVLGFVILDFSINSFYIDKELKALNLKLFNSINNLNVAKKIDDIKEVNFYTNEKNEIESLIASNNRERENYNPIIFGFIYGALAIIAYLMK
jgi:hypothetical protein